MNLRPWVQTICLIAFGTAACAAVPRTGNNPSTFVNTNELGSGAEPHALYRYGIDSFFRFHGKEVRATHYTNSYYWRGGQERRPTKFMASLSASAGKVQIDVALSDGLADDAPAVLPAIREWADVSADALARAADAIGLPVSGSLNFRLGVGADDEIVDHQYRVRADGVLYFVAPLAALSNGGKTDGGMNFFAILAHEAYHAAQLDKPDRLALWAMALGANEQEAIRARDAIAKLQVYEEIAAEFFARCAETEAPLSADKRRPLFSDYLPPIPELEITAERQALADAFQRVIELSAADTSEIGYRLGRLIWLELTDAAHVKISDRPDPQIFADICTPEMLGDPKMIEGLALKTLAARS